MVQNTNNEEEFETSLTIGQIRAIMWGLEIAVKIQRDFPEIIEDYRANMLVSEIIEKHSFQSVYGAGIHILRNAISAAIRGHKPFYDVPGLEGLIDREEANKLCNFHKAIGLTEEERSKIGKKNRQQGLGIFSLTSQQRKENSRMAGVSTASGRGFKVWLPEEKDALISGEKECAYLLSQMPEYQWKKGNNKGNADLSKIANKINGLYHEGKPVRDSMQVRNALSSFKRFECIKTKQYFPMIESESDSIIPSEVECAYLLSQIPEYKWGSGISTKKIADKINELYHEGKPVRDSQRIGNELRRYRKKNNLEERAHVAWFEADKDSLIPSEIECVLYLAQSPEYQIQGKVDRNKIADKINELYHEGKNIRTGKGISGKIKHYIKQTGIEKPGSFQRTSWKNKGLEQDLILTEEQFVYFLAQQSEYQHQRSQYRGDADSKRIAEEANRVYHKGEKIRDDGQVKSALARMKRKMKL